MKIPDNIQEMCGQLLKILTDKGYNSSSVTANIHSFGTFSFSADQRADNGPNNYWHFKSDKSVQDAFNQAYKQLNDVEPRDAGRERLHAYQARCFVVDMVRDGKTIEEIRAIMEVAYVNPN